jgi:ABC-type sugar transport system ATPase subunit
MSVDKVAPVLVAKHVKKYYGHVRALDGADLTVQHGEIHALLGDNGAGKSTLIKIISGALVPTGGKIILQGREVAFKTPKEARKAGIETVYQDLALASTLDAGENIFLGVEIMRDGLLGVLGFVDRKKMRKQAIETIQSLGANLPSWGAEVGSLSGGQMQAVAIARAIKWGHKLIIMDEPTAALGAKQREIVLSLLEEVKRKREVTVLLISHNMPDVFRVADRATVLRHGKTVLAADVKDLTINDLIGAMTGAGEVYRKDGKLGE